MNSSKKINILGTEYEFTTTTAMKDVGLMNRGGYCDPYAKKIVLESEFMDHPGCVKDIDSHKKITKRHEIIHAYLYESGLTEKSGNEELVEWIAWQFQKLVESFKEVDAI